MNHASLFSGLGGFDLAAELMGWTNIFHCENNPFCKTILRHYWANAIHYEDIKTTDFRVHRGQIDVLTGGFPCQPFSNAGKRRGTTDERYLWPQMLRAIREIRPTWVVGENVFGITSMVFNPQVTHLESKTDAEGKAIYRTLEAEAVIERICLDFEEIGYHIQPMVIPACAVEAPHRRDRVWFLAHNQEALTNPAGNRSRIDVPIDPRRQETTQERQEQKRVHPQSGQDGTSGTVGNSGGEGLEASKSRCIGGDARQRTQADSKRRKDEQQLYFSARNGSPDGTKHPGFQPGWQTQSPICGGDDGLSGKLDGLSFSKLRKESIKGYGNAVVVPLVVEIFRGIEAVEGSINKVTSYL